jgi:hypothetical protein
LRRKTSTTLDGDAGEHPQLFEHVIDARSLLLCFIRHLDVLKREEKDLLISNVESLKAPLANLPTLGRVHRISIPASALNRSQSRQPNLARRLDCCCTLT